MKEIKFRAWKESEKRMLYWEELCMSPASLVDDLNRIYLHDVMQYTGLKDKNGKEIYEGDHIRCWNGNKSYIWHDKGFWRIGKKGRVIKEWEFKDMEIIGNIYE